MSTFYADEAGLIRACLDGKQSAWDEFVGRYGRLIYSIARRYHLSTPDAEDVFQNVFTIALNQLTTLRNPAAVIGWLARVTHHECQHLLNRTHYNSELTETIPDRSDEPQEHVLFRERQMMVLEALSELDPRSRQLLTFLFLESDKPSYEEIAARLKIPVGSIGPYRIRGLKKLEAVLKTKGYDEELKVQIRLAYF